MEQKKIRDLLHRCALAAGIALVCFVLFGLVGMDCRIKSLTGLPCPTCGMSRAWLCALRLDLPAAFFWHPLFWTVPLVALALLFGDLKKPWLQRMLWLLLGLFLLVYLGRMVLFFPDFPPMDFYKEAVLPRFFSQF